MPQAPALRLEIAEFVNVDRWRWRLTDANGAFLADYEVALDPQHAKHAALFDLPGYLWQHSAPDTRDADERRLIDEIGVWIGETVLGRAIGEKIADGYPPIVVSVIVPEGAERLMAMPLEIAQVRGKPLALQGVSLVFEPKVKPPKAAEPIGDRLRMLAVFSLPPAESPLNLRRERQALRKLVGQLANSAIELRVLQYGVTRQTLREILQDGEGWDLLHFSGHGLPGSLVLEKADGSPDEISGPDVASLLRQSGRRLKLVVLSSCLSAAASIAETMSWLNIKPARDQAAPAAEAQEAEAAPTVAHALLGALDCAVVAMRYSVEDDFAIGYARGVYEGLFSKKQSLPHATQIALEAALREGGAGALSAATPAVFGAKAPGLKLTPPKRRKDDGGEAEIGLSYFPREPERFVGRVTAMTKASAALAADSDHSGVLFHGMAGAGKTSCAVELAYQHQSAGRFSHFVFYKGPEPDSDIQTALLDFALALERQTGGLEMAHLVDNAAELKAWLPRLTEWLENNAALIVLDNLENLLSASGQWRDERWALVIAALLTPGGLSRTVLTSRIRPANLPASTEILAVHALPLDEALLLMRDLPNLRRLLEGKSPGVASDDGRWLARRALLRVQGHPKLIEFAEKLAADPQRLTAQLDSAAAAPGGELDAFFRVGESGFDDAAFLRSLREWTTGVAATLPEASRIIFHFLCAIEESDREGGIIEGNWADLWKRLGRPEPAPSVAESLAPLVAAGLVERKAMGETGEAFVTPIHPGVAEAGRAEAGPAFQEAVDAELAATWVTLMRQGLEQHGTDPAARAVIVRAGLAAFPYLSRRGEWDAAAAMLEKTAQLDATPATNAAVLLRIRSVVEATAGTDGELINRSILAKTLRQVGRNEEAEQELGQVIGEAEKKEKFQTASTAAGDLSLVLRQSGRLDDALKATELATDYARRAGSGPWTLLRIEVLGLQIRLLRGEHDMAMRRASEMLKQMRTLPDPPGDNDLSVSVWNVREMVLDIGKAAAVRLGRWQDALDLVDEISKREKDRGADELEQAITLFNVYGPLLGLGRYDEARAVLLSCRATFERKNYVEGIGNVLGALANLDDELGHLAEATSHQRAALRFDYMTGDPESIVISHFNLADYLKRAHSDPREALAHLLAAAATAIATSSGQASKSFTALARHIEASGEAGRAALPADFDALCKIVGQVEGVRFADLIRRLVGDAAACEDLFQQIVAAAIEAANAPKEAPAP